MIEMIDETLHSTMPKYSSLSSPVMYSLQQTGLRPTNSYFCVPYPFLYLCKKQAPWQGCPSLSLRQLSVPWFPSLCSC